MKNGTGILNLDCFNNYKKTKEAILNSKVIEDNIIINEFFIVMDDCTDHLRQFGNFENSIKEISDFLYEKYPSYWINLLVDQIFDNFTGKISNNYDEKRTNREFDKLWLYVHYSIPSKTLTKNIILNYTNNSAPLIERIRDLARDENNCFNAIVWNNNKILLK